MAADKERTPELAVDYGLSVEEWVEAGRYDHRDDRIISSNFPATQRGEAQLRPRLVCFECIVTTESVLTDLGILRLRVAKLPEVLAFGAKHPNRQREYPIVGLGSSLHDPDGSTRYPELDEADGLRRLNLASDSGGWNSHTRFLAFP